MREPLGYFLTWTTKSSWLHGDERGSVVAGQAGIQPANEDRRLQALQNANNDAFSLSKSLREDLDATIRRHCQIRNWTLHVANVRTQHVHVVVTATGVVPETVMSQLKAWCSRTLSEKMGSKRKWWTEHGSTRWLNSEQAVEDAIVYVRDMQ